MNSTQVHQQYLMSYQPQLNFHTTYSTMNEWRTIPGRQLPSHVPVTISDNNWKQIENNTEAEQNETEVETDEIQRRIDQIYATVTYPKACPPRERQGRIGGSWRHIKEVLGHGGSRVVFVDGLVRLYDADHKFRPSRSNLPPIPNVPRYAPSNNDVITYRKQATMQHQKMTYSPWKSATF